MFVINTKLCFKSSVLKNLRRLSNASRNSEILCDIFGLSKWKAKMIIDRYKLQHKDGELLVDSINYCKKLGYSDHEILQTPMVLRAHPLQIEQHYMSMEEGGFITISPRILARARYYMQREIKYLKARSIISQSTNVPQNILKYIEDKELADTIPVIIDSDYCNWNYVHLLILQSFLKKRLDATDDEIIKLFRTHKMIKNKSFRVIQENISLAEELGFERRRLLKYGYLLHNYPTYPKTVLNEFPNVAGADMKKAMRQYPKLIMTSPKSILKVYGVLKEFGIEDDIIRKQMNVFHMAPETVRLRLEEIKRLPDLHVLLKHPKILSLVLHHNRARSRLSFLQQLQLKCASLVILGTDDKNLFEEYITKEKDINKPTDVIVFLKTLFKVDDKTIKKKYKNHPYYLQVPLKDMQDTYDYLITNHFQNDDIIKVMHVILYPVEKVKKALKEMKLSKDINYTSLCQVKKLRLVLYYIEKEHHFTGNGIWRKCSVDVTEKSLE